MATYNIAANEIGAHSKTLTANTVDTVRLRVDGDHEPSDEIEVYSDGTAAIYFTTDGSAPTVGGAGAYFMPPNPGVRTVEWPGGNDAVVKLISAGTPTYSVARTD